MKKIIGAALAATMLMAGAAEAQQQKKVRPSYTYGGVKYITQDLDDYDCTQDGLIVDGSFDIDGAFFVRGAFSDVSGDNCGSSSLKVGGGYRAAWGESAHIYGTASFMDISADAGGGDTGLVMGGGMRGYVSPGIEAYGEVEYSTLDGGGLAVNAGGAYWFNGQFAITGDIGFGSDARSFAIGGRMAF